MVSSTTLAILLLGVLVACLALPSIPKGQRKYIIRGRPEGGMKRLPYKPDEWTPKVRATAGYFANQVDHFDNSSTKTYQQRYWYNDAHFQAGGPVFFMLGGEGPESPYWVEDDSLEWGQMAVRENAFLFLAEHRFYGDSRPTSLESLECGDTLIFNDMSTANLRLLTSEQAIEDFAAFIVAMKQKFPQLANSKWVTFGGTYSGALAAWMRVKHPELVSMAVGSSGPVFAETDFVEYLEVVQASISRYGCGDSVAAGFNMTAQLLQTAAGRKTLKSTYSLCEDLDLTNPLQIQTFWSTVYGPYMETVQYSGENAGNFANTLTIQNAICRFHNNTNLDTMTKMKQVNRFFDVEMGYFGCSDINYDDFVKEMKDTSFGSLASTRAWVWQTCNQFGYYQSTDSPTAGPWFGRQGTVPVSYYTSQCSAIYGSQYNADWVNNAVTNTNNWYGGRDNIQSSMIVFPNGNVDPWHALGKLQSSDQTLVPVIIDGAAHCADMYPSSSSDSASMIAARKTVSDTIHGWLNQ